MSRGRESDQRTIWLQIKHIYQFWCLSLNSFFFFPFFCVGAYGGPRTSSGSWFFLFVVWILGIELRLSSLYGQAPLPAKLLPAPSLRYLNFCSLKNVFRDFFLVSFVVVHIWVWIYTCESRCWLKSEVSMILELEL